MPGAEIEALRELCRSEAEGAFTPAALRYASAAAGGGEAWSAADGRGWTPLHQLCQNGSVSAVLLVASELAGAEAWGAADEVGHTPLYLLCKNRSVSAELLRVASEQAGAEAWGAADGGGWTPLHWLCENSSVSAELLRVASELAGAEAWAAANEVGYMPLHLLCENSSVSAELVHTAASCMADAGTLHEDATHTHGLLSPICQHRCLSVDLLDAVARVSGAALLRQPKDGKESEIELLFKSYAPPGGTTGTTISALPDPEDTPVQRLFDRFDENGNGRLSKQEYKRYLLAVGLWGGEHSVSGEKNHRYLQDARFDSDCRRAGRTKVGWLADCEEMGCKQVTGITRVAFETKIYGEYRQDKITADVNKILGKKLVPLDWLMLEGLWARIPASGYRDCNPLAVATRLKKVAWVEAIVGALTERTAAGDLKRDLIHRIPGLPANIEALFEIQLGKHAVRLLGECGVRKVPGSLGVPAINPAAGAKYKGASERSECEWHPALEDWVEGTHGKGTEVALKEGGRRGLVEHTQSSFGGSIYYLTIKLADDESTEKRANVDKVQVISRAKAWEALAASFQKQEHRSADSFFPQKPPVLVDAEPVMLAIDGAAGPNGLLPILLKYTAGE